MMANFHVINEPGAELRIMPRTSLEDIRAELRQEGIYFDDGVCVLVYRDHDEPAWRVTVGYEYRNQIIFPKDFDNDFRQSLSLDYCLNQPDLDPNLQSFLASYA